MSDNRKDSSCLSEIINFLVVLLIVSLIVSYCHREDKDKGFIDSSIESIRGMYEHVDSVWHSNDSINDIKDAKRDETTTK